MDLNNLISLVPQGSMLGAVLFLVIIFLNYMKECNKVLHESNKACEDRLALITEKNAEVIKDNTKALTQLQEAVKDLKPYIKVMAN